MCSPNTAEPLAERPQRYLQRQLEMVTLSSAKIVDRRNPVNSHFEKVATYWAEIYEQEGVTAFVHQERLRIMLDFVDRISIPAGARVLDIGCGAGLAAVALARRGYRVDAVDTVPTMVESTRHRAKQAGVEARVRSTLGDVTSIPFADASFPVVVAMGVLPWLPSVDKPLQEIHRVLQPGGSLIVSVDNRWALCRLLDPFTNPLLGPAKELAKRALASLGWRRPRVRSYFQSANEFQTLLARASLEQQEAVTLGFGPFTVFHYELLPNTVGLQIHKALQGLAERGLPLISRAGSQTVVVAAKR